MNKKVFYGHETIDSNEKTSRIGDLFDRVAPSYDVMNDVMSLGQHRKWKDSLIRQIRPRAHWSYLDLAGGTGDIAFRIRDKLGIKSNITIADLTPAMLEEGKKRAIDKGWLDEFTWVEANAEELPFDDKQFDIVTMSFGLRNVGDRAKALAEIYRVLKSGGQFYCMEFSPIENPMIHKAYSLYTKTLVPTAGRLIARDQAAYDYLLDSIDTFPKAEMLKQEMQVIGFSEIYYRNKGLGTIAIHKGIKT